METSTLLFTPTAQKVQDEFDLWSRTVKNNKKAFWTVFWSLWFAFWGFSIFQSAFAAIGLGLLPWVQLFACHYRYRYVQRLQSLLFASGDIMEVDYFISFCWWHWCRELYPDLEKDPRAKITNSKFVVLKLVKINAKRAKAEELEQKYWQENDFKLSDCYMQEKNRHRDEMKKVIKDCLEPLAKVQSNP